MPKRIDVKTGDKYGRLTIVRELPKVKEKRQFLCKCDCGKLVNARLSNLRFGQTNSCGCLRDDQNRKVAITHGESNTRLYRIWAGVKRRCFNATFSKYGCYGGRGITVCDEWLTFTPFREWALANGYEKNLTIDRINNNGNYEPSNCRWITIQEQQFNKRPR